MTPHGMAKRPRLEGGGGYGQYTHQQPLPDLHGGGYGAPPGSYGGYSQQGHQQPPAHDPHAYSAPSGPYGPGDQPPATYGASSGSYGPGSQPPAVYSAPSRSYDRGGSTWEHGWNQPPQGAHAWDQGGGYVAPAEYNGGRKQAYPPAQPASHPAPGVVYGSRDPRPGGGDYHRPDPGHGYSRAQAGDNAPQFSHGGQGRRQGSRHNTRSGDHRQPPRNPHSYEARIAYGSGPSRGSDHESVQPRRSAAPEGRKRAADSSWIERRRKESVP